MPEGLVECNGQFIEIIGASIGQCVVYLVPNAFIGVEFRRVGRESLEAKSREATTERADGFAFVGFAIVPDHDDLAAQMMKQMAQESANLGLLDVLTVELAIQPKTSPRGADRQRGNGRELVVLVGVSNAGSLAARSPGTADRRDQEISGFVDKSEMGTQPGRVFFMRGQSRRFQASMAASSRCVARRSGFWQVHSSA